MRQGTRVTLDAQRFAQLGSWSGHLEIDGERIAVDPASLPEPNPGESASLRPSVVGRPAGVPLQAPEGFVVTLYAEGLQNPRWMAVAENGDVFLAEPRAGHVLLLRDADGDGLAEQRSVFVEGLDRPHGLALHAGYLYVGDVNAVWRLPYRPGDTAPAGELQQVTPDGALDGSDGHWTRNIAIDAAGRQLYVAIGSASNLAEEAPPRASVQVFDLSADGGTATNQATLASGLRNPVGIAIRPESEELWVVVNERDRMGDGLVPDYLTHLEPGGFYGWPYAYIGAHPQPELGEKRPDLVAKAIVPDLLFRSHSAPIGLVFYDGDSFPAEMRGDAFVALRGSWNANNPVGYMVVRVPLADGRPEGFYETFLTGFRIDSPGDEGRAEVWGRPAGLAVAPDGSLLVADDTSGTVWRVSYAP
jgi:glucose/arabinose dehydrogenase